MLENLAEETINQIYMNSIQCNGIHGVDFIRHRIKGDIIKISHYLNLDNISKKEYMITKHLGIKQEIKENIWIFCLFTSQKTTELNNFIIYNTELTNSFHKYINYPIIVENSTLCEYFLFHDDIQNYPKYCKNYIMLSKDPYKAVLHIFGDSLEAYLKTLYKADFNKPITIENAIYKYYEGRQDILMNYSKSTNFMRYINISNENIIEFTYKIFKGKNIKGEDIIQKSIKEVKYNNKVLL